MPKLTITTPFIKLDQLLKLAGWVGSGGQAKDVIAEGEVSVNGSVEMRRGRKLIPGDQVEFMGQQVEIQSLQAREAAN